MTERDQAGRHVLVTGANTGIGRVTAVDLAKRGARVLLACRSEEKTKPVIEEIVNAGGVADFLPLDLADFSSIRKAAKTVLDSADPLDILINNAGLAGLRGLTKDGFEITIGTNHLGPFLLTTLLLPKLRAAKHPRIVNVASGSHYDAKELDFSQFRVSTRSMTGIPEYAVSKLCNVLFTKSLASGKAGGDIKSYSLHPGVVASDAWRQMPWPLRPLIKLFMISNEEGAKTSLYCATSNEVEDLSGEYFDKCKVKKPSKLALDSDLAEKLWEKSEEFTAT